MDRITNDMSWRKCFGCEFMLDITCEEGIKYLCKITGNTLLLENCKYVEENK